MFAAKPLKKKRVMKRDPNQPGPKPWSEPEMRKFREMLTADGVGSWKEKAAKLGTGRSAKALHTRWLREEGRIIDKPRGRAAQQQQANQEALAHAQKRASEAAAAWGAAQQVRQASSMDPMRMLASMNFQQARMSMGQPLFFAR